MKKLSKGNILSCIFILFFLVLLIVAVNNKYIFNDNSNKQNDYLNVDELENNTHYKEEDNESEIIISEDKIFYMNENVEFIGGMKDSLYIVNIDKAESSKELYKPYEFKEYYRNHYGVDFFDDIGNIQKEYNYLYLNYTITNSGENNNFYPTSMCFVATDENRQVILDNNLANTPISIVNAEDENEIKSIDNFKINTAISLKSVYIIPDDLLDNKEIYIYMSSGKTKSKDIGLEKNIFIKLRDIINRD